MEVLPNPATGPQSNQILQSLFTLEKERDVLKAQCISLRNKLKAANNLLLKLKQDSSNKKPEEPQKALQHITNKYQTEIQTLTKELETTRNEYIKLKKQINTNNDRSETQICDEHENKILELEVEVKEWKKKHTDLQLCSNKKQKMKGVSVSIEKEEYEKMKEELQSLKENYSLLNDENRLLTQCEKNLQSEVDHFRRRRSNRKACENNKEVLNLRSNYSLVSRENERLKEREKILEKEIENLKKENCKGKIIKSYDVAIVTSQQSDFDSMESMSIEGSVSSKPPGLGLIDLMGNVEENIEKPIRKQDSISGVDFYLSSSSESEDEVEENNEEKLKISNNFLDDTFSSSESENEKEGGNKENSGEINIYNGGNQNAVESNSLFDFLPNYTQFPLNSNNSKLSSANEEQENQKKNVDSAGIPWVAKNQYTEKLTSPKPFGLGLIGQMDGDKQNFENPHIGIQSKADQDLISCLNLSLSSSESENEERMEEVGDNGSTGIDAFFTPSGEFKDLNLINNSEKENAREKQEINPDSLGINDHQNGEKNIIRFHSPEIPKKNKDFYFNSKSEEDETMVKNSKIFTNASDDQNFITEGKSNYKRSIFSPTSLELKTMIKAQSIICEFDDLHDELSPPPLRDELNVTQKDVEEDYQKLNTSIKEEMEKLNGFKLDLIETEKQFKSIVKEERIELDSVKQNFENEMAKQEEQLNVMKIKMESVHEKLNKTIEDQKRSNVKIVRLEEKQSRWNLIKLDVVEPQKKLSCMAEELQILKEENKNLKMTLETSLAKNEELGKLNHEMSSTKVNSDYLTIQQATALVEKVARKEIRKHVTRENAIMKVKLKNERNKLVRVGFKRGRRSRRIESEVVVPTVRVCQKVKEDDEIEENGESVEAEEKAIVFGVDGMIIPEGNEKYDGGKTNDLSFAERNTEMNSLNELKHIVDMETVKSKASDRVKILDYHTLKPALVGDFLIAKTSTKNVLEAIPHGDFKESLIKRIEDVIQSDDDPNDVDSDDKQDQSFDDGNMLLNEKSPENVLQMIEDAQIKTNSCLSESDSDESLIIDECCISDYAEMSHLIDGENLLEEIKIQKNVSSLNDLGLPANPFKRKRSIDETNSSRKIFALSTESRNETLEEENTNRVIDSSTSLTYKCVKTPTELLLDTPTNIYNSGLAADTEKGISLPPSSKVQILENQSKHVRLPKSGKKETKGQKRILRNGPHDDKEVYLQTENAVLMLFEIPSDSMINLLLKFETKILCKVIVKLSTEDFECKQIKQINPIAPILSEYQIVLLRLLIAMTRKDETTKNIFLKIAETAILNIKSPIHLEPLSRLHVAFMKYFYEFPRAKAFIFRSLTKMGDLAIPYLYFLGTSWPDVFVNYEATSGNDRLLAKMMMKLITFREIKDPEYFKIPLTNFLNQLYKYPRDLEPMDMLLKEIVKQYMWSQCDQLKVMVFIIGENMSVLPFFKNILVSFKVMEIKSEKKVGVAVDLLNFLICNASIANKMVLETIEDWISSLVQEDYSENMKNTLLEFTTHLHCMN